MIWVWHLLQWAYGVTLWEIYNGGKTPYTGIQMAELSRKLEDGYRMEKPRNAACTEQMYVYVCKDFADSGVRTFLCAATQ